MKKLFRATFIFYTPQFPKILVYMLQSVEYRPGPYLAWFWRTQNFTTVMHRRQLTRTRAARALTALLSLGMVLEVLIGLGLIYLGLGQGVTGGWQFGLALVVAYPIVWAHLIVIPLIGARELIVKPNEQRLVAEATDIFRKHKGVKIAIAGSYGKTTMKELLNTVLSQGKNVAVTPANMNVAVSHAKFAASLTGAEDVLLIEYGEGEPGDVAFFARTTHPTHGVITGLAPAHLDRYKTVRAAGEDIFSLATYLKDHNVYVNVESPAAQEFMKPKFHSYDREGVLGWKASKVRVSVNGLRFTLSKGKKELKLHSGLLGRHQLGPLSLAVALAHEFGLTDEAIIRGVAATRPFEHRMQPYLLAGAWVIDDTYNGNVEGIRAGTELLKELPAKRKIYVTPGLVDQGNETERVHVEMGECIAAAKPDLVVLMHNSTTEFIRKGLLAAHYEGELRIETDPLGFYTNLAEIVAAGDVVLMQNDWPDNYA